MDDIKKMTVIWCLYDAHLQEGVCGYGWHVPFMGTNFEGRDYLVIRGTGLDITCEPLTAQKDPTFGTSDGVYGPFFWRGV